MPKNKAIVFLFVLTCARLALALDPNEILVITNGDCAASVRLARYYCAARGLPKGRIVRVFLGTQLRDSISRNDYETALARPIRRILTTREDLAQIACLVTTYGIPFKVGQRGLLPGSETLLQELRQREQQQKDALQDLEDQHRTRSAEYRQRQAQLNEIQMDMNRIAGRETGASVDSELSLLLSGAYELYRWQPNGLRPGMLQPFKTLMVCRLDGPGYGIAKGLVDKALKAERDGLTGVAYIDSRGLFTKDAYGYFDQSVRDVALLTQLRSALPVKEEQTAALFAPDSCPQAALYCGWYSLRKYVDAFTFVDGAVGFHIASYEAVNLRDPNSTQWCPAMLKDGITATLGAVAEPYLPAFPEPKYFFMDLFSGSCLVEAYYHTKPFNSWQLVLIGDPLYRPFKSP